VVSKDMDEARTMGDKAVVLRHFGKLLNGRQAQRRGHETT